MKRSNLALAVLTAIAVAACGGSSSNDDAPVDKKPETPAKPVKPTTPEAGNTETPEEKTPETPETPAVAGGGAGGAGGKTDTTKKDEKKPEAPAGGGHGGGSSNNFSQNLEEAELQFGVDSQNLETFKGQVDNLKNAVTNADNAVKDAKTAVENKEKELKGKTLTPADVIALQGLKDTLATKEKEHNDAVENLQKTQDEIERLDASLIPQQLNIAKLKGEPQSVIDYLNAQQKFKNANKAFEDAKDKRRDARSKAEDIKKEIEKLNAAKKELEKKQSEAATAGKQDEVAELANQIKEKQGEIQDQQTKLEKANTAFENAKAAAKAAKKTKEKAEGAKTAAETDAKYRGTSGTAGALAGNLSKIQKVTKDKETSKWMVTFDKEPIDVFPLGKKDTKFELKNGTPEVAYGTFGKKDEKFYAQNTIDEVTFGYADDKFYQFGQATPEDKVTSVNKLTYNGTAFLQTKGGDKAEMLTAQVTAETDFKPDATLKEKLLKGHFKNFQTYLNEDKSAADFKTYAGITGGDVAFTSKINGNTFTPVDIKGDASVSGNFYGDDAKQIGGMVDHSKFSGSFGGKAE